MNKTIIIIILLLGLALHAIGQPYWFPAGAKWYFDYTSEEGYKEYFTYEVEKDTVISGKDCKKLIIQHFSSDKSVYDWGHEYVYQSNNKIYHYHSDTFNLMYNFGLEAGDTLKLNLKSTLFPQFTDTTRYNYVIDSLGDTIIDEVKLKTQYIRLVDQAMSSENLLMFEGIITEKMGNHLSLFGSPLNIVEIPPWYGALRCYVDSEIEYHTETEMPCDTIIVSTVRHELTNSQIKIYPNPFTSNVWVSYSTPTSFNIRLYSLTGELIFSESVFNEEKHLISLDAINEGLYLLFIQNNNQRSVNKIIKSK